LYARGLEKIIALIALAFPLETSSPLPLSIAAGPSIGRALSASVSGAWVGAAGAGERTDAHMFLGFDGSSMARVLERGDGRGGRAEPAGETVERAKRGGVVYSRADLASEGALESRCPV
jgi:hypothetical protein